MMCNGEREELRRDHTIKVFKIKYFIYDEKVRNYLGDNKNTFLKRPNRILFRLIQYDTRCVDRNAFQHFGIAIIFKHACTIVKTHTCFGCFLVIDLEPRLQVN
jgi:hypothetical protein